jgi:hypothetical protein
MAEKTVQDWMAARSVEGQAVEEDAIIRDLASRKEIQDHKLSRNFADQNRH